MSFLIICLRISYSSPSAERAPFASNPAPTPFWPNLERVFKSQPQFALETGGTDINEFKFPEKGICIIGSEELGVSPEALKKATYGRVTIPMKGLKASLNVGVAFGILMPKWVESLEK